MIRPALRATVPGILIALALGLGTTTSARADFIGWNFFGTADSIGTAPNRGARAITISERRVSPTTTITAEFTNGGTVITNANGSHFGYRAYNPHALNDATTEQTQVVSGGRAVRTFNGMSITGITFTASDFLGRTRPGGVQQVSFFDPAGGMKELTEALASAGFTDAAHPLVVPAFSTDLGQPNPPEMFLGVALQSWAPRGIAPDESAIGSRYQVTDGLISGLLGGSGPSPGALDGFFFSRTPLVAGSTSFTGSPFTGVVEISSFRSLSASGVVPEPTSMLLLGIGAAMAFAVGLGRGGANPRRR